MNDMEFFEKQAFERAAFLNKGKDKKSDGEKIKQKVTSLPVEFPKGYSYPDFKAVFKESTIEAKEETAQPKNYPLPENKLTDLLRDPEAALLTGLIMLLKSEGADETLLASLGYILL